jgi:hypothetical protein
VETSATAIAKTAAAWRRHVMSPAIGLLSLRELTAAEDSSDEAVHLIGLSPSSFGGPGRISSRSRGICWYLRPKQ